MEHLHEEAVKRLQDEVRAGGKVSLAKQSLQSNTTRSSGYKNETKKLSIDGLNRILSIDPERLVALCEPRVSMYELASKTARKGLIPLVVPEFKGITVGGAINGCGGESTSHKYGLFHDICTRFEVLLGDGSVINASQNAHEDLFHGLPGSYGSLGLLLSAEVKLQKAPKWVHIKAHKTYSAKDTVQIIDDLMHKECPPEYLEGVIFSKDDGVVLEGNPVDAPVGTLFQEGPSAPWYYQFAKRDVFSFSMPLIDYLFRYDRGAFWMGAYVFRLPILKKLFLEGIWKIQQPKPFTDDERFRFANVLAPNGLARLLTHPFSSSQFLFSFLHSCEEWVQDRFVVQDFTLPTSTVKEFFESVDRICPIYPLWLCPVKAQKTASIFAPHSLNGANSINIGVYGIPKTTKPLPEALKELERELHLHQGKKWLYTNSCYSHEEFWNIYSESEYNKLRTKYNAVDKWLSIEKKVLSN